MEQRVNPERLNNHVDEVERLYQEAVEQSPFKMSIEDIEDSVRDMLDECESRTPEEAQLIFDLWCRRYTGR